MRFGNVEILNCDCMDYMRDLKDNFFDLAIVDPPYGIGRSKTSKGPGWAEHVDKGWDKEIPPKKYFDEIYRVSKNQIIWGGNYFVEHLKPSMGWLVWDKGQESWSTSDCELAYTSFQKALRRKVIFRYELHQKSTIIHPTQKPVKLYNWCMSYAANVIGNNNFTVLDTHLGSGSSAIAAHYFGCDFVGCEIDEEYYLASIERFEKETAQMSLL